MTAILTRSFLLFLVLLIPSRAGEEKSSFAPSFYPFQNGVRFERPEEGAAFLKELGYDGIGSVYGKDLAEYLRAYEEVGLRVHSIYVGGELEADGHSYEATVTEAIARLKGSEALVELFVRGGEGNTDAQAVAFVREIADQAEASGLRVVLYPHAGFYIDSVGDALRIAKASGRENVGLCFNLCHFLKVEPGRDLREVLEEASPYLWSVSVCGADPEGTSWKELIQPLDEGSFDQAGLLRELREIGYEGPVGLQCYGIKIESREHLPRSLRAWKKNLAASSEFIPLFDGKSFEGWEGNLEYFRVEDGAIAGGSLSGEVARNEYLCSIERYEDFELRLKFKVLGKETNAGIQIRSERVPDSNEMIGYQADLGDPWWGCLYDERRHKSLVVVEGKDQAELIKAGQWNDYRIRCEGGRVRLWVNGRQTVDYTEPDKTIPQSGVIGLQIHKGPPGEAWYKDIRIKTLSD